ncbi:MAG: peptidylprolyl isomerase, partial [Pseudomonadota bacterium]
MIRRVFLTLAAVAFAGVAQAQDPSNTLVIEVEGVEANGVVEIELLPDLAPQHVDRIKELAAQGAYDGVAFHRVIEGFMAQTGDVEFATRDTVGLGRAGTGGS